MEKVSMNFKKISLFLLITGMFVNSTYTVDETSAFEPIKNVVKSTLAIPLYFAGDLIAEYPQYSKTISSIGLVASTSVLAITGYYCCKAIIRLFKKPANQTIKA